MTPALRTVDIEQQRTTLGDRLTLAAAPIHRRIRRQAVIVQRANGADNAILIRAGRSRGGSSGAGMEELRAVLGEERSLVAFSP